MRKAILFQCYGALLGTALGGLFFGLHGALSALIGGVAVVVPGWLFARRLDLLARRGAQTHVATFVIGELVKLMSSAGILLAAALGYSQLHWGALLIGMVLALKSIFFAFLVRT